MVVQLSSSHASGDQIVEDEACDPTDEFITRGEKKGTCGRGGTNIY